MMRLGLAAIALAACAPSAAPASGAAQAAPVGRAAPARVVAPGELTFTRGRGVARDESVAVDEPVVRAVVAQTSAQDVTLRFVYRGPTAEQVPLASGESRIQIGVKLRAQNGCNVVYAMWRLAPQPGLVVQTKSNPGQDTHDECGASGYVTAKPRTSGLMPAVAVGELHTLHATLDGLELKIDVDGARVWEGTLDRSVLAFDGPVGLRSDNGRFDVTLLTR